MLKLLGFHPFYGPAQLNKALPLKLILFIGVDINFSLSSQISQGYFWFIKNFYYLFQIFIQSWLYLTVFSSSKPEPPLARY